MQRKIDAYIYIYICVCMCVYACMYVHTHVTFYCTVLCYAVPCHVVWCYCSGVCRIMLAYDMLLQLVLL